MTHLKATFAAVGAALFVAACSGGGSDVETRAAVTSLKVMGDSLADSGTFGFKFTVQGADSKIYPELIAQTYGLTLCNAYVATSATTFGTNSTAGCSNYAVGGSRINSYANPSSKLSIVQQLQDASATGNYSASDMLLIDGGGNDAADLVGAYLAAATDGGAAYSALLLTLLSPTVVGTAAAGGQAGLAGAGGSYMVALADKFHDAIKTLALDRGAQRIVVLNMPGVTNTPRFQMVLDSISAASGGGTAGATARAQAEGLFKTWVQAFNTELASKFAGNSSVAVVDFYTTFNAQITTPSQFALTNVTTPTCPIVGLDSSGLPTYDFPHCTDAMLMATMPPTGAMGGANWWKTYAFSDSFHPTPYGHQLVAQLISNSLAAVGWL